METLSQSDQHILLRRQATLKAQQGDYAEAIALLNLLISREPMNAGNYANRGLVYFQNGAPERALSDYNRALRLDPRLAKAYNNRANCYVTLGQMEAAIADYDRAIDLNPLNLRARINQSITYRDLTWYDQALECLDEALQLCQMLTQANPVSASFLTLEGHIHAERGRTYHRMGDWNCAVADYRQALLKLSIAEAPTPASSRLRQSVESWLSSLLPPLHA